MLPCCHAAMQPCCIHAYPGTVTTVSTAQAQHAWYQPSHHLLCLRLHQSAAPHLLHARALPQALGPAALVEVAVEEAAAAVAVAHAALVLAAVRAPLGEVLRAVAAVDSSLWRCGAGGGACLRGKKMSGGLDQQAWRAITCADACAGSVAAWVHTRPLLQASQAVDYTISPWQDRLASNHVRMYMTDAPHIWSCCLHTHTHLPAALVQPLRPKGVHAPALHAVVGKLALVDVTIGEVVHATAVLAPVLVLALQAVQGVAMRP